MPKFLRLRQICLIAADLERECAHVKAILGVEECHRDANVAKYGLENALFPVGSSFLEIVSPTRPGTAAGRFLERHEGRFGYMVILDCDDPERRQRHAEAMGVRVANLIRHGDYLGVQLHPKDTGGAMLEFNRTLGGEDLMGPYAPAGPDWQRAARRDVTRRLLAAEIECPDPRCLAERWGEILERAIQQTAAGGYHMLLDAGAINFLPTNLPEPVLSGIELQVADRAAVMAAARARGCPSSDGVVSVCGIGFRLSEAV